MISFQIHNRAKVWGQEDSFLKEINTFIQQGCIKLIKRDSKDICNGTKRFTYIKFIRLLQNTNSFQH